MKTDVKEPSTNTLKSTASRKTGTQAAPSRRRNAATRRRRLTAIDLFAGCGGLSLGLKRAGFDVLAAIELDEKAADVYARNHLKAKVIVKDICEVSSRSLLKLTALKKRELDLLAGCPPCQGFSRLPRRNGRLKRDPRNTLLEEFTRHVVGMLPKAVLFENVPAVKRSTRFRRMVATLKSLGYDVRYKVLNAHEFGVPQRRRRLILIASRIGEVSLPVGDAAGGTVRSVIGGLGSPKHSKDPLHKMVMSNGPRMRRLIARIPKNGGSRGDLGQENQLECHRQFDGFKDVYGRMRWGKESPTITSGCFNPSKGRFLHPQYNRPISMREAALLQSFPASYIFPVKFGLTATARFLGDALPPRFAEKQARHVRKLLTDRASRDATAVVQ